MIERYRKWGRALQLSVSAGRAATIVLSESGEAERDGDCFRAFAVDAIPDGWPALPNPAAFAHLAGEVTRAIEPPVELERLTLTAGSAEHEISSLRWKTDAARLSMTLVRRDLRLRVEIRAGGKELSDLDLGSARSLAQQFRRAGRAPRRDRSITLEPALTAALWPALIEHATGARLPRHLSIWQAREDADPIDGVGRRIGESRLFTGGEEIGPREWPNSFRPSYRIPPIAMPFHLDARLEIPFVEAAPAHALALVGPMKIAARELSFYALVADDGSVSVERLRLATPEFLDRLAPSDAAVSWVPLAAGAVGRRLVLTPANRRRA
jgi:hypothetical protein